MPRPEYLMEGAPIAYHQIPVGYMAEGMQRWIEQGLTGANSFIANLVANRLFETLAKADTANADALRGWLNWLRNRAPPGSYGSEEAARRWANHRGLAGAAAYDAGILAMKRVHWDPEDKYLPPEFEAPGMASDEPWTWSPTKDRVLAAGEFAKIDIRGVVYRGRPVGE
jgi:hypothetical protein